MKVKVKKLNPAAVIPTKAHPTDAGFDLVATSCVIDEYGNVVYGTGLAFEIPEGYVGLIFPRSSICKRDLALSNAVGVIDSHYRGEVMAKFKQTLAVERFVYSHEDDNVYMIAHDIDCLCTAYKVGERIAQLIIMPIPAVEMVLADELSETDRGEGGYGSTGR
jgi:dUTP pyrophosphatase